MDEPSNANDFVDEHNVDLVHIFLDTLEVPITAQVKENFVDTCVGEGTNLNGMFNLEAYTIPIAFTTALDIIK